MDSTRAQSDRLVASATARRGLVAVLALSLLLALPAVAEQPLRLVFSENLAPLSFREAGSNRGILIDIASDLVVNQLGLSLEVELYPWERAQAMVRQGHADGFITIATSARREYAKCGNVPVIRATVHPLLRKDHAQRAAIAAVEDLAGLRDYAIVSYFGNGWARQNLVGFDVFFAADYEAQLRGLAQGRGDLALVTDVGGAHYLRKLDLEDSLVLLPLVVDTFEYVLCLSKQSPHLARLQAFEVALGRKRGDGSYAAILQHYGLQPNAPY
ncbi:MAG: transporter substrate-binding domain-containing protein [Rhodospirillaceae bacterium]|nr:transporter substrate-binding domain-containing protein [Rhodospirillaceae bacterium]